MRHLNEGRRYVHYDSRAAILMAAPAMNDQWISAGRPIAAS